MKNVHFSTSPSSQAARQALLIIDPQNDFLPGGALAVSEGDQIVPVLNALLAHKGRAFALAVASQDWHPADHSSFVVNDPAGIWPVHCVAQSQGAAFAQALHATALDAVFQKGSDPSIDSYSAFFDNDHRHSTGLDAYLRAKGVQSLLVAGLATDYCVKFTVLDALWLGYAVQVVEDACRAVNLALGDGNKAMDEMCKAGATRVSSTQLARE